MQTSSDLITAFRSVCEYSMIATDMFQYRVVETEKGISLQFIPSSVWIKISPMSARQAVDQAMAGTLNVFYLLSGRLIFPKLVNLVINKTKNVKEYERVFQSAIKFNAGINEMIFDYQTLQTPIRGHDQSLFVIFDKMLQEIKKNKSEKFSDKLKQLLMSDFKGRIPPINIIASHLNITIRSLQRRLAEEKTSYRQLASGVQKEIATQLLAKSNFKVKEIARLLGYSDSSAFRRAYKNWI